MRGCREGLSLITTSVGSVVYFYSQGSWLMLTDIGQLDVCMIVLTSWGLVRVG